MLYLRRLKIEKEMRNLIITALVAVCVTFQGEVRAEVMSSMTNSVMTQSKGSIAPELLEKIFRKVECETSHSYACLCSFYDCGRLFISKAEFSPGYQVQIQEADGGITIISIIDDF